MPPYKRRIFLINRRFQLRLALYVCSWLLVMSFIYPLILQNVFEVFIRYAEGDPNGPAVAGLLKTRDELMAMIIGSQILFLALTFLVSLFLAHRIAGPLYKLRLFFGKIKAGDISQDIQFRKFDHFKELADDYNGMVQALRQRVATAATHIERAAKNTDGEARRDLQAALQALPNFDNARAPGRAPQQPVRPT